MLIHRLTQMLYEAQKQALRDPLTQLGNRRAAVQFLESLPRWKALGIAMIDLDRFKGVNDEWGHDFGDTVLRGSAHVMSQAIEEGGNRGRLFRWGGEEFLYVQPGLRSLGSSVAYAIHRRLWEHYHETPDGGVVRVTGSIGAAAVFARDWERGLRDADAACYAAKNAGRDRVCHAPAKADGPARVRLQERDDPELQFRTEYAVVRFADGSEEEPESFNVHASSPAQAARGVTRVFERRGWIFVTLGDRSWVYRAERGGQVTDFSGFLSRIPQASEAPLTG